ncbi:hypothetical protein [Salinimicrobium oceani]|uniref:Uncharacterized protein n=1 Tax=Salinimicrobium oceani TaxID=2722702 RepID=A0ABX1CZJ1_9FLAO|nr:hypothetical protein [Salinimicrobium oceani]NJW52532.1 hypothetical protein [Salinimicrobium oceani]
MNRDVTRNFSANEKEIERLLKENNGWKNTLSYIAEELNFLILFLSADVFRRNVLNMYEQLQVYYDELQEFRKENLELIREVHNHRYDIEGILECEDIGCEVFYHNEHVKLGQRILEFSEKFRKFKLDVFAYTGKNLKKTSKEH